MKTHVFGLRNEFKKRRIATKIIAPRRSLTEDYGKDVILLGTSFPLNFGGSQSDFVVHFNSPVIDDLLTEEKFDVLHFHNFGFPSSFQILEKSNALNILTFHSNVESSEFLKAFPVFLYLLEKFAQWKIDGIIGVALLSLEVFKNYSGPKIIIPNGVDTERFNKKTPKIKKFDDGKINILFVGRIDERKGLIYLLKAYEILKKKIENIRLIVVGDGELKEECQDFVKSHNLKEVFFEGEKTHQELPSYFSTSQIFVSPAIFGESFGIVILEAMAAGLPVVGFANQGYKEFMQGKKGEKFLVKPKNYKALAKKIEILIQNKNLRRGMSEWGIKETKKYSWSRIADQVLDFYRVCQKNKEKQGKEIFSLDEIVGQLDKILNKDVVELNKDIVNLLKKELK